MSGGVFGGACRTKKSSLGSAGGDESGQRWLAMRPGTAKELKGLGASSHARTCASSVAQTDRGGKVTSKRETLDNSAILDHELSVARGREVLGEK